MAGPAESAALLEDKAAAYEDAEAAGLPVPPFRVVRSGEELLETYEELTADVGEVCLKPVTGASGEGFRILTRDRPTLDEITGNLSPRVHVDDVASAIDARAAAGGPVPKLMLLPFMPGPEVSVDCLADQNGDLLAAVPRTKISRRRLLVEDQAAVTVARRIVARHKLSSLSNTQVRYWQWPGLDTTPRPYLLETNTRLSGGLYQTAFGLESSLGSRRAVSRTLGNASAALPWVCLHHRLLRGTAIQPEYPRRPHPLFMKQD